MFGQIYKIIITTIELKRKHDFSYCFRLFLSRLTNSVHTSLIIVFNKIQCFVFLFHIYIMFLLSLNYLQYEVKSSMFINCYIKSCYKIPDVLIIQLSNISVGMFICYCCIFCSISAVTAYIATNWILCNNMDHLAAVHNNP
jgi:hypothetical protein